MDHPLIFICSPYRGDVEKNSQNAREYCRFAFEQGGIPFAPHLLFTQFLDDDNPEQREAGMRMGLEMMSLCDEIWTFGSPTHGMKAEILESMRLGIPVHSYDENRKEMFPNAR